MTGAVVQALVPVILLVGLGRWLDRARLVTEAFWPQAERLAFYVLLPALFLHGLATADLAAVPVADLAFVLVASTLAVAAFLVAARPSLPVDGPAFTSIFQGGLRFNNYVGVTLAAGLYGPEGVALAAVCNAAIVPTVNLLSIMVFARYGTARPEGMAILRQMATNPLVLACVAGGLLRTADTGLPAGIDSAAQALGTASLPLGLLCVGAALSFKAAGAWFGPVLASSLVKFLLLPAMTLAAARTVGLEGPAVVVALLFQALPTASSAYIMARQLGGDAPLMAGITATQTVLAVLVIPFVLGVVFAM